MDPFRSTYTMPIAFGLLDHLYFNRREPRNAVTTTLLFLFQSGLCAILSTSSSGKLLQTWAIAFVSLVTTLFISIGLYRLSPFHPLASIPGPLLPRLSKLHGAFVCATGQTHEYIKSLHDKYGNIVRIGPNDVSICDVDAVTTVFGTDGLRKGTFYDARQDPTAPKNLFVLHGEAHDNRRRLWNRGFSSESIDYYTSLIFKRGKQLVKALEETDGRVDLSRMITYFSWDFMGDMAFGGGFETIADKGSRYVIDVAHRFMYYAQLMSHVPWFSKYFSKIPLVAKPLLQFRAFALEKAKDRLSSGSKERDLWYHLTDDAGLEKVKPPVVDVISDGALAIIAGADTTATALTGLFYFLCMNPDSMDRVQEEIQAVFPMGMDASSIHDLGHLEYLNACISETLRLLPPVPTSGPRQVTEGDTQKIIAGRKFPVGTQVYVPPYCIHRDGRYFTFPDNFAPSRWLSNNAIFDPTVPSVRNQLAFIPFSYGPANCAGRHLARRELLVVSSLILQRFNIRIDSSEVEGWPSKLSDYFTLSTEPLYVRLELK